MNEPYRFQIVIYDLVEIAEEWIDKYANPDHMDVCEVITPKHTETIRIEELHNYDGWDYLLVLEKNMRHLIAPLLEKCRIPKDRILYGLDVDNSLCEHRDVAYYIFNETMQKTLDYFNLKYRGDKYALVSTADYSYINCSTDRAIVPRTLMDGENWSKDEMEFLKECADRYFEYNEEQDLFCDIGANIGTTCIYFKNHIDPEVQILAIEPMKENYKLLKTNMLLNDINPENQILVRMGVSDSDGELNFVYDETNPGGSGVFSSMKGDSVPVITFDGLLDERGIDPRRIKYIWVDVEGFEARFIKGAAKTLDIINAPVFIEFVPKFYTARPGEFELLIEGICEHFNSFICASHPEWGILSTEKLKDEQNNMSTEWDIILMRT